MTEQQIIDIIEGAIVANGNNEITADVLRPVLVSMVSQINDLVGDLNILDTIDKNSLVGALNEVFNKPSSGGINILNGTSNPNTTAPASFELGDFYNRTSGGNTIEFYIYNGNEWVMLFNATPIVIPSGGAIREYDNTYGTTLLIAPSVSVAIYTGSNSSAIFTLPLASNYDRREIILINQSTVVVNTNVAFRNVNGVMWTEMDQKTSITIKSNGTSWVQIR